MAHNTKWRMTIECLHTGQPAPYKAHINRYRVLFEITDWRTGEFGPSVHIKEDAVRKWLTGCPNWTEFNYAASEKTEGDYFRLRLNYLKEIEPGLWEYQTSAEYTG